MLIKLLHTVQLTYSTLKLGTMEVVTENKTTCEVG